MKQRRKTREVMVGKVGVGGSNPVRNQSMTTSSTRDVEATIEQVVKLADHGCEIARVTVQGKKEAAACEGIKNGLLKRGYNIPLVADIHFYPPAAMDVVEFVDKVRINPGNFVDRRATFREIEYTDDSYALELEKIRETFVPFIEKCKKYKRSIRIGTNHGSLSDRIMNRYGDTPAGMVESAFEFTRVARELDFHEIIYSMKASNPLVMIEAYRLLVQRLDEEGWDYPLHLGVTEAGDGEDGRVKSAIGTGSLLLDGIGDTIRVSLTEDPWLEIAPCNQLIEYAAKKVKPAYFHEKGTAILHTTQEELDRDDFFEAIGCKVVLAQPEKGPGTPDALFFDEMPESPKVTKLKNAGIAILTPDQNDFIFGVDILRFDGDYTEEAATIEISAECGRLLTSGNYCGLMLPHSLPLETRNRLTFAILQGCRMRQSKTEYIACPGCGRTLFDIQSVTQKIRARTSHLPGVNIAIMGCIVNGPGEMADADFGYVGSKSGKIDLYVEKTCVERNIDESEALEHLIDLLKEHGRWVEPEEVATI